MTSSLKPARRGFLQAFSGLTAGLASLTSLQAAAQTGAQASTNTAKRPVGAKYMGDFVAPKLSKVKVAIIGVGARGSGHAAQLAAIEGVQFVGICDLVETRAKKSAAVVGKSAHTQIKRMLILSSNRFPFFAFRPLVIIASNTLN